MSDQDHSMPTSYSDKAMDHLLTPIFISGIGRSGTSALIKAIAQHRSVLEPERIGEAPFVNHFVSFLTEYEDKSPEREYHLKNYRLEENERRQAFGELVFRLQYGRQSYDVTPEQHFWCAKASLGEAAFVKATALFGEVRVIHIVRNGIEVVNSARKFAGFSHFNFEELCQRWAGSAQGLRYLENQKHAAVVKHDEMVQNPDAVFSQVFEKLGMLPDDVPASFINTNVFNSSFDATETQIDTRQVFENRTASWFEWTPEEQETFTRICDETMQRAGFFRPYAEEDQIIDEQSEAASSTIQSAEIPAGEPVQTDPRKANPDSPLVVLSRGHCRPTQANYHLNASAQHRYLFIENPKVASTTILEHLIAAEISTDEAPHEMRNAHDRDRSPLLRLSEQDDEAQSQFLYSPDVFRFTFVRNPFSRLLSAYLSKIARPLRSKLEILSVLHEGSDVKELDLNEEVSFDTFVAVVCEQENRKMNVHWRPQVEQIFHDRLKLDFIGRFENLEADLSYALERATGVKSGSFARSANATGSSDLVQQYYSEDIRRKVVDKFRRDFDLFGYSDDLSVLDKVA